jgi:hypothetical protein
MSTHAVASETGLVALAHRSRHERSATHGYSAVCSIDEGRARSKVENEHARAGVSERAGVRVARPHSF